MAAPKHKAYPIYKLSGVERLGDMPRHWELKKLKYKTSLNDETLPETTEPDFELTYVDIGSVDASKGITTTESYRFENAPSRARRIVRDGDTIVSTVRTYLRAIAPIREPEDHFIVSTGFAVIRPRTLDSGFLSYVLRAPYFVETIVSRSTGVSYPAINASEVGNILVPIPPLPEQQAIAAFLDRETVRIDGLIEKKQRQIELLQEKRAALISHAVTKGLNPNAKMKDSGIEWLGKIPVEWTTQKIKNIAVKIGSGKTPRGGAEVYVDSGVMLLRSQNIHFSGLRLDDVVYVEPEINEEMINTQVHPNDVLLNITGASLGRSSLVPGKFALANVNQHVCIIRPKLSKIIPPYLFSCICSNIIQSQIFANENGTSREGLNFQQIGNLIIVLPSLAEQHEIAMYLDQETARIDGLINKVEESIALLREYRTALISAAVTGKIKVNDE